MQLFTLPVSQHGLTLIELLITVSIGAILLAVAVPSFSTMIERNKLEHSFNVLYHSFQLAREHAVYAGVDTTVCPSVDSSQCQANWGQQLIIFVDKNNNSKHDSNEPLLHQLLLNLPTGQLLAWGVTNKVSFKPLGHTKGAWGRLCFKKPDGSFYMRKLVFSLANFGFKPVAPNSSDCQ